MLRYNFLNFQKFKVTQNTLGARGFFFVFKAKPLSVSDKAVIVVSEKKKKNSAP